MEGAFTHGNSVIHRLDPRVKLILAFLFSVVVAVSSRWSPFIPGFGMAFILVLAAGLPLRKVFARLIVVNGLILFLWFFLPFTVKGMCLWTFGPFVATKEGTLLAALITIRSNVIVLALLALVSTTPVFALGHAMKDLGVPEKIVQLFFFTSRYIHVIHGEYQRLIRALKMRGFRGKSDLHTYRTYAYLVGMLLVRSYERAERVKEAMLCRGFQGRFYALSEFHLGLEELFVATGLLAGVALTALLEWI
jgi:cobalt/nickel transport system permease protein